MKMFILRVLFALGVVAGVLSCLSGLDSAVNIVTKVGFTPYLISPLCTAVVGVSWTIVLLQKVKSIF